MAMVMAHCRRAAGLARPVLGAHAAVGWHPQHPRAQQQQQRRQATGWSWSWPWTWGAGGDDATAPAAAHSAVGDGHSSSSSSASRWPTGKMMVGGVELTSVETMRTSKELADDDGITGGVVWPCSTVCTAQWDR